ncbi:MAG: STAS domain-containing protein [Nitrospirae bacterium]|nr:STAS domain-containing protein [Nitrospirota bacterium]MBF0591152.1 STAS domain-containing protein [Nitrospirota bacterium]
MVTVSTVSGVTVIALDGSIDSNTVPDVQKQVFEGIDGKDKVVIDMKKVSFLSSAGLRMLMLIYRQMKARNGKVVLVSVMEEIVEVMKMTGFINFFVIADNLDAGIKAIG